jgi:hypothetical protein
VTGSAHAPAADIPERRREAWVDVLRVGIISGVIVVHTATAYIVDIAEWY